VLGDETTRSALLTAVARADRLVLLGDVIELRQGPLGPALAAAREMLANLSAALPPGAPIVLLAGNHDHALVAPWLTRRDPATPLGAAATVEVVAGDPLADVVDALGGAGRTTVAYPGAWVREDVWATHGHYSDRHTTVPMFERLGAGVMARIVREAPGGPTRVEDYEAALAPMYAWIDALAQTGRGRDGASAGAWSALAGSGGVRRRLRGRVLAAGFPLLVAALNRARIGPLSADLSGPGLRGGALGAIGEVQRRLAPAAAHVVFGHTHRAGPRPTDDAAEWRTPTGAALVNTGCWVREPAFTGPDPSHSPYRTGFAVWVHDTPGTAPELVNLLD
jgi:hypothetical protein